MVDRVRGASTFVTLLGPALVVVLAGIGSTFVSRSNEIHFLNALVAVAIVVAIYVFVGSLGVLSFGQISFVAVGAFAAGVLTVPLESKTGVLPEPLPAPARPHDRERGLARARRGGRRRLRVPRRAAADAPLGARRRIATFAVLEITHNLLREWIKIGPGATTLSLVPETTGPLQATMGALIVIAVAALPAQPAGPEGPRHSRGPAAAQVGISVHRQRLWAFTLSGAPVVRRRPARACSARSRPSRSTSS